MAEESYWDEKRTHGNIFDLPDGPPSNRAFSARSRKTSTFAGQNQLSSPALIAQTSNSHRKYSAADASETTHNTTTPLPATIPRVTKPSTGPDSSLSVNYRSDFGSACFFCKKKSDEANLLTEFEGKMVFCKTACRLDAIKSIAEDLVNGRVDGMYELKSIESKCVLLDEVIKRGTSDSIIRVTVYMSSTSRGDFHRELKQRQEAFRHYVSYLKHLGNYEKAADLLDVNGNFEEAGMLRMTRVPADLRSEEACNRLLNISVTDDQINLLIKQNVELAKLHGKLEPTCKRYSEMANQLQNDPQSPEVSNAPPWLTWVPTPKTLFGVPLMSTLLFMIVYDGGLNGQHQVSKVRNIFKIHERHLAWVCLQAFSLLQMWSDLESAIVQKNFFRADKSILPPERVARYVRMSADAENSKEVRACISRFVKIMEVPEERFSTALDFGAWEVALNTAIHLKDKGRMIQLHRSLEAGSHPWSVTKQYLENPPNKWKPL